MSEHERNAKVLTQIMNKLAQWSNRKLSMATRILVSNQVIFASSGADLAKSVLHKARAMVRNFIWGGDASKNSRAKVGWDSAILPLAHGAIIFFNQYA